MKIKFSYIMLFLALTVAACAGYFSVWGLSQLFAGASTAVIIMASVLEVSKVVATTALHRYWGKIAKLLKIYLTISVGVLMLITSAGIYGFLSNAYQKTANKLELLDGEVGVLTKKKDLFKKSIEDNQKIVDNKTKRIDQLSSLRTSQENRFDLATSNKAKDKIRGDIQKSNDEIQKLTNDIDVINSKNTILTDSINKYDVTILKLSNNSDVGAEVGPLKYISKLTNQPMDRVVNFLILLLIFVFDPLAIALVLITNRVIELEREQISEPIIQGLNESVISNSIKKDDVVELTQESEAFENDEPILLDEQYDDDYDNETEIIFENNVVAEVEPEIKQEIDSVNSDLTNHNKIQLEDIKEVKNRGFSMNIPQPKRSNINRIE